MSILFYRRPDYVDKIPGLLDNANCQKYVERTQNSKHLPPPELSFDRIMRNETLPPMTLGDFMDYMMYVSHDAEILQFYLWYCDYAARFELLNERDKALSPEWDFKSVQTSTDFGSPEFDFTSIPRVSSEPQANRNLSSTFSLSGTSTYSATEADGFPQQPTTAMSRSRHQDIELKRFNQPRQSSSVSSTFGRRENSTEANVRAANMNVGLTWQGFTIQPYRTEIMRVTSHYLAPASARYLPLSPTIRASVLHALQHTTHPSAFAPALDLIVTHLRHHSHSNFVRWSICNGNTPRVFFVRTMGVVNTMIGFLVALLLALSKASRWWRILAAIQWFIGITTLVAAYKGLCVILHHEHRRNVRPWEDPAALYSVFTGEASLSHVRMGSINHSRYSSIHRLFDSFGDANDYERVSWSYSYNRKSLVKKIFDNTVVIREQGLKLIQDKIVKQAQLWAAIITRDTDWMNVQGYVENQEALGGFSVSQEVTSIR